MSDVGGNGEARAFKWVCLALATIAAGLGLYMVNDVRGELKRTNQSVHEHLPALLANAKTASDTMAHLAKDLEALRDLMGMSAPQDRSLVTYADSVLDFLEKQPGAIGVEKLLGKELKDPIPAADWARDARKEALWLTFRASTKAELLDRLGKTAFGSKWFYAPPSGPPIALIDLVKQQHAESATF